MSLLSELKGNKGSTHKRKRLGRGDGSGHGGTASKGHKGQKARTGGKVRRGFEGGQMPLHRRLPKVGFVNIFRTEYSVVNVSDLNRMDGEVNPTTLSEQRLVRRNQPVKILGDGKLEKALAVKAHKFSKKAKELIESAGGSVEVIK